MDPERDRDIPRRPDHQDDRPANPYLLPNAEPDAELAQAYAAWRLDRPEKTR